MVAPALELSTSRLYYRLILILSIPFVERAGGCTVLHQVLLIINTSTSSTYEYTNIMYTVLPSLVSSNRANRQLQYCTVCNATIKKKV